MASVPGPMGGATSQSGVETIPTIYTTSVATVVVWNGAENRDAYDTVPEYMLRVTSTPSFQPLQVNGSSSMYAYHVTQFGLVPIKITKAWIGSKRAPAYADVILDGVRYQIQVGAVATVPRNVLDCLNNSSTFTAVEV